MSKELLFDCLRIRMVEEKIIELYPSDLIQSPVHLSIGQEAVAVGVSATLKQSDWVFITYRGHAFYLARGGPLPEFFAELMGKRAGMSKGKAGSMHLAAPKQGVIGASAVVASTISHAVGAALAAKVKGEKNRVFVANFGDGAMEQGVFHESMNFAALHQLPVLFLCEDNGLAVHARPRERQAFSLSSLVAAYGIPYFEVPLAIDPDRVAAMTEPVIRAVRDSQSPRFLRVETVRYREHVGPGEDFKAGYRSEAEVDRWKKIDPLMLLKDEPKMARYRQLISAEIEAALSFAMESPLPTSRDLLSDVI